MEYLLLISLSGCFILGLFMGYVHARNKFYKHQDEARNINENEQRKRFVCKPIPKKHYATLKKGGRSKFNQLHR